MLKHVNWDCQNANSTKIKYLLKKNCACISKALHKADGMQNQQNILLIYRISTAWEHGEMGEPVGVKENLIFSWKKKALELKIL